jgi:hypothetical protein
MVFIDGDHLEPAVRQDIDLWLPKAKRLICGHDFGNKDWPAVEKVVKERFGTRFTVPAGMIWAVNVA